MTGLAAILGSGAYLITLRFVDGNDRRAQDVTAVGTVAPQNPAAPEPTTSSAGADRPSAETTGGSAAVRAEPSFEEPADRVRKARDAAAKEGVKITRPLPLKEANPAGEAALAAAKEVTTGSAKEGGATRVITVRGDLTGQRELGWVAGGIEKHGEVSCSQRFKLYNEQEPKTRPSLLVCWRTSEKRSVIVVDTKIGGRPPVGKSLGIIEREWRKLG
ncbi:hypothetical protein [Actinoplanes philippinensis]|uniref:hypothetical protein n=1 Tax=Actinoplanes philippinensis TaxID=35752 RepID=UPI0011603C2F|nr:hypothetical protein [Actinoplanes philippinensis]